MAIYLVRHGKDDDSVRGGWSDHGLAPEGVRQVQALAEELASKHLNIDRIYSSDIPRAAETAQLLSHHLGYPIEYLPQFREANNGSLAGMKHGLADKTYPGIYWSALDYDQCYPGGESPQMFYERIKAAWPALKRNVSKQPAKDALLVTHGGVIEAILCLENGITFSNKTKHFSAPSAALIPVELP